jgi:hypothetical protein
MIDTQLGMMGQAYNPNFLGGIGQEDGGPRQPKQKVQESPSQPLCASVPSSIHRVAMQWLVPVIPTTQGSINSRISVQVAWTYSKTLSQK